MQQHIVPGVAPPAQGELPGRSEELPHGLLAPPATVREQIEAERAKHPPQNFALHEERLLNERTVGFYFDGLHREVIYRPTPAGPEVLAVGSDEVFAFRARTPLEEQARLKTFLGY